MATAAEVMAVLAQLLEGTRLGDSKGAAPIAFELDGEAWGLDPARTPIIERGRPAAARMTLRSRADLLLRLLSDPDFALHAGEELVILGDTAPLHAVMQTLAGGASPLSTRMASMMQSGPRPGPERGR